MPAKVLSTAVEADFGAGWVDVSADLRGGLSWDYGITGSGPTDRCASSGALRGELGSPTTGRYAPDHAACRAGWGLNTKMRVRQSDGTTTYTRFLGRVRLITPMAGRYVHAGCRVSFEARDWLDEAAELAMSGVTAQVSKRGDEILTALLAGAATQPEATSFDTGDSIFPYALDDAQGEQTRLLSVCSSIAQSEQGYIYLTGDGTLVFEGRTLRASRASVPALATLNDAMTGLSVSYAADGRPTRVKVTVNPRQVDPVGATTVLFKRYDIADGQTPLELGPGSSMTVFGSYGDPDDGNAICGGTGMVPPVATTDYTANAQADGLGATLTAALTVVASCTASGVSELLTNTGAASLFVTRTQVRGRRIKNTSPMLLSFGSGSGVVTVDMPYEGDVNIGSAVATMLLAAWGVASPCEVTFLTATDALLTAALTGEPGSRITLSETATGLSGDYFVQSVACALIGAALMRVTWRLAPADTALFAVLDQVGACELDATATIGY